MCIRDRTGSLNLNTIIKSQADGWWIFKGHIPVIISFVIFIIAVTAETNRAPFDLAEAESELKMCIRDSLDCC